MTFKEWWADNKQHYSPESYAAAHDAWHANGIAIAADFAEATRHAALAAVVALGSDPKSRELREALGLPPDHKETG